MKISFQITTGCVLVFAFAGTVFSQQYHPAPHQSFQTQQGIPVQQNYQQGYPTQTVSQHWTQKFNGDDRQHDFGVVPSYSDHVHVFEFKNDFEWPIHLVGLRTSCRCTNPEIVTSTVAPGETGKIKAVFDTKNHYGKKGATITVSVRRDQPYTEYGEIQFQVKGFIRRDVVLNPGTVSFDNALIGKESKKNVMVRYAGNPEWQIASVTSTNPNITIATREIERNLQTKRVDYELTLALSGEQSAGRFVDQIQITTTDTNPKNKILTVNVQGNVRTVVKAAPVQLGVIEKGQEIYKNLVIKGERAFGIRSIKCGDSRVQFESAAGSKTLHVLKYRLDTSNIGQVISKITIVTDDPAQGEASIPFEAQIVPATFAGNQEPR